MINREWIALRIHSPPGVTGRCSLTGVTGPRTGRQTNPVENPGSFHCGLSLSFDIKRPHTNGITCFRGAVQCPSVVDFPVARQPICHLPCFPMSQDTNPPATKADIDALMESNERWMGQLLTANARFRDEILESVRQNKTEAVEEMRRHFDVVVEGIRHDLLGANRDEVISLRNSKVDHEQRLLRLERSAGFAA